MGSAHSIELLTAIWGARARAELTDFTDFSHHMVPGHFSGGTSNITFSRNSVFIILEELMFFYYLQV